MLTIVLFYLGFDTTMQSLTFILFMIAHHNDVAELLLEEIQRKDLLDTYHDLNGTKYLDAVIKESIRLYPPAPFLSRVLGEDTVLGEQFNEIYF